MSPHSRFWRTSQMILAMISVIVTQELEGPERSEDPRSPAPFPVSLPVTYQVLHADFLLLREANQNVLQNASMQSHAQPLVLLRASQPPSVSARYGPVSVETALPPALLQTASPSRSPDARLRAFLLTRRVGSSAPGVRVLFYGTGAERGGARPRGPASRCSPSGRRRRIGSVTLLQEPQGAASIAQLKLGDAIVIQTSSKPLRKTDIATFYVFMASSASLDRFTLRATVKKGVSFRTATPSNSLLWETALDPGADGTISITCQRKTAIARKRLESSLLEILQLDFEAEELSGQSESQVIAWRLEVPGKARAGAEGTMRIHTTQRDFVGLAPLVTDSEILNTAVLTGKSVRVAVRTVAVEQDGSVTDVSELTDCRSTDEDVLKVSDRCDYVFVNGKEMRGKVSMAVNFTYSYLSAQLEMSVWIPRLPLQIEVSDSELSQIKGWRVPIAASNQRASWDSEEEEERKAKGCSLQFQHALVRVLTHLADRADRADRAERLAYFLGEDWQVDVTALVRYFLKVEDPRIARLQGGRVLEGRDPGVTSIQVMSPLSDSILAEKTVTVLDDRVTITELGVQLVSGLSLSLQLSPGSNRAIVATATTQEVLQSPKQEAVLSSWIQLSDGSLTPLGVYEPSSYTLAVTSLDEGVVSVRKGPAAVVVAEGEGQGALVRVEMLIGESCQKSKRRSTLAVGSGALRVRFRRGNPGNSSGGVYHGNAGEDPQRGGARAMEREESARRRVTTTAQDLGPSPAEGGGARAGGAEGNELMEVSRPLSDLEIGMYALLGVFCLAILVFLVNCVSYALRFGRKPPPAEGQDPPAHRHDWVWLDTDADLVRGTPDSPLPRDGLSTAIIDIGPARENAASAGRRASLPPLPLALAGPTGPLRAKPARDEPLHSPTSRRRRVRFTTFTAVLEGHRCAPEPAPTENGTDVQWVGKEPGAAPGDGTWSLGWGPERAQRGLERGLERGPERGLERGPGLMQELYCNPSHVSGSPATGNSGSAEA
ncbi:hypothetical protein AAFF_G00390430 [Aldrovandia affinis]|uniref:Transmembrane protein 132D n=1 Tax=Aldrovandia affinis TaxID=143900 RepID=A0AAD7SEI9_9TELE|nr:hypothetical protein AAFF_G00390430 [Aldrovandia affinis]